MTPAKEIMEILIRCKVIPSDYVGQVVLHIGQGGLCDVERRTKGLKRLLEIYPQEDKSNGKMG
jgi:hypothetical protein